MRPPDVCAKMMERRDRRELVTMKKGSETRTACPRLEGTVMLSTPLQYLESFPFPRNNPYLVSKLFDVTKDSTLKESVCPEGKEIVIPFGKGVMGLVS